MPKAMSKSSFQFLIAFIIFLGSIQEGLLTPSASGTNDELLNQITGVNVLRNRLDQLEAKVEQLESERNSQQIKIDQLEKKLESQKASLKKGTITHKPSSCLDLLDLGHTLTGFYDVLLVGSGQIASIYCDFALEPTEADFETRVGFVDVKSDGPVHFFVTRNTSWSAQLSTMPFQKEFLNLGGGMNLKSGVFTVPKTGIYAFSFKAMGSATGVNDNGLYSGYGDVNLLLNGTIVARGECLIYGARSGTYATLSLHATLKVNKGDSIAIKHAYGTTFSDIFNDSLFTGSLLEEDLVIS